MFFTKHLDKMLLLTGIGTAAAFVYALFPQWAVENIGQLQYVEDDVVFYRHWGVMVGMMGVMMIGAARNQEWRSSILTYSAIEKSFMVFLVLSNLNSAHIGGFVVAGIMDTVVVLWTLAYWWETRRVH